ncbi:hypothetical protein ACLB2K_016117 [Fragaria x ananassa]
MTAFKRLAILFLNAALALNIYPVSRKFGRYRLVGSHDMVCAQCTSRTDQLYKEHRKSIAGPKTTIWACTHILTPPGSEFTWHFKINFFGTTRFNCYCFRTDHQHTSFDVFWPESRKNPWLRIPSIRTDAAIENAFGSREMMGYI